MSSSVPISWCELVHFSSSFILAVISNISNWQFYISHHLHTKIAECLFSPKKYLSIPCYSSFTNSPVEYTSELMITTCKECIQVSCSGGESLEEIEEGLA